MITEADKTWFLTTEQSTYVVGLSNEGLPTQRYWGPRLPEQDWSKLQRVRMPRYRTGGSSRPEEIEEELLPCGGERWGLANLQIEFEGGDRGLELELVGSHIECSSGRSELTLRLCDAVSGLQVHLHYVVRTGTDVIERWTEVELPATASGNAIIRRLDSANWFISDSPRHVYSAVSGYWGSEFQVERASVPHGELTLTSRTGNTSHQANPWVMVHDESTAEETGEVRSVALAWSGSWRLTMQHRGEGGMSVSTGFGHDELSWQLRAGSRLRTPASFGLFSHGGIGGTSRAWHAFEHRALRAQTEPLPVLYNSWYATKFDVYESEQMRLAAIAAELGAELFVVDDGWFSTRTSAHSGLGDWRPNLKRFPNGLAPLREVVRGLGMGFGLWVEPEMVNPDSDLYRAHPDWVLHFSGRRRREKRNQLVLNFAREDVRTWALDWLSELVEENELDYLKWDMNRPFSQAGWPEAGESQDILWVEHITSVYSIMEALRRLRPGLRIESCTGGGGRVDLGVMSFTDQFWPSDNTDAIDRQAIQHGYTMLYTPGAMTNWVTDSPDSLTGRVVPLEYRFHVAMSGVLGIGGTLESWTESELAQARALISQYKTLREVVQFGALYRLGGVPGREASAVQYVRDDRVVVIMYDPRRSLDRAPRTLRLAGLTADATYTDVESGVDYTGDFLMNVGLVPSPGVNVFGETESLRFSGPDFISSLVELRRSR